MLIIDLTELSIGEECVGGLDSLSSIPLIGFIDISVELLFADSKGINAGLNREIEV